MTTNANNSHSVGDLIDTPDLWDTLPVGTVLQDRDDWIHTKVYDSDPTGRRYQTSTYVDNNGVEGTFGKPWDYNLRIISFPTYAPGRPLIDFSTLSRSTARAYAIQARSRALRPDSYDLLTQVGDGSDVVDAYALNRALLDAMRSSATRYSGSSQRKHLATKVAYLGHIVQAVLENHADQLPAYAEGDRSRAVEEAKSALVDAREEVDSVVAALESRKREVEELRAALEASHAADQEYRAAADAEVTRLLEIAEKRDALLAETVVERDNLQETNIGLTASLEYALGILATLNQGGAFQVLGFMDASGIEIYDA